MSHLTVISAGVRLYLRFSVYWRMAALIEKSV